MPKLPEDKRRDQQLNFSLTRDELTRLRRRADQAGMRLLDFGRILLLREGGDAGALRAGSDGCEASPEARERRLLGTALIRVGNNLNQIARRLHSRDEPAPAALEPLLTEIRALINREHTR